MAISADVYNWNEMFAMDHLVAALPRRFVSSRLTAAPAGAAAAPAMAAEPDSSAARSAEQVLQRVEADLLRDLAGAEARQIHRAIERRERAAVASP